MLGQIFTKSQNKIQDPAKLYKLVDLIDKENWVMMGADVKGDIYEGLLEKNAEDTKNGAGQYFTPRSLIRAMVECVRPEPMRTIADPACFTGGFFLAPYDFIVEHHKGLDREQKKFLKLNTFYGNEIVAGTRRLALMNLFLHNIGDIDMLGQGSGREPDAIIKFSEEHVAFIIDAKAYSLGYSLGTDDRAIREYINYYCPKLRQAGFNKIGFIIVSNSFKSNLHELVNSITWNTDVKRFILLTSEALLYLLAYKTKDRLPLNEIIDALISYSTIVTKESIIEKFGDY